MTPPNPDLLADLARQLAVEDDRDAVLRRVLEASLVQVGGAEHAGITVLSREGASTPLATDDLVRDVDRHQYAAREGPCLTAVSDGEPVVRVDDLRTDPRWPRFSAAIAGFDVRSMLSFQLYTGGDGGQETIGALNIYAAAPGAFDEESVHTGTLLATHAAVAAAAAVNTSNLQIALRSRDTIGQAKGILMERFKITPDQAFDLLVAASTRTNRKLRDVAELLTATGELVMDR